MPKEDKKHFLGWHSWYVAVEADNLKCWLDCVASVKTLRKSQNRGGPTSRGGSSQDLPSETRKDQGKVTGAQESTSISVQLNQITKTISELGAIFLG